jgi:hypothetical protein
MKFTAIGNIFSAEILGFTPWRPRKNSEAVRCFSLFFRCYRVRPVCVCKKQYIHRYAQYRIRAQKASYNSIYGNEPVNCHRVRSIGQRAAEIAPYW